MLLMKKSFAAVLLAVSMPRGSLFDESFPPVDVAFPGPES